MSERHSDKSDDELRQRAWEIARSIGICMLVTTGGGRSRARPMGATVKPDEHAIYLLTDSDDIVRELEQPRALLTFSDTGGNKYVCLSGRADVERNPAKVKELWGVMAKAWWDSPDDPAIRVVTITPDEAELWDSPGKLIAGVKMLAAAATGSRPDLGETARVRI